MAEFEHGNEDTVDPATFFPPLLKWIGRRRNMHARSTLTPWVGERLKAQFVNPAIPEGASLEEMHMMFSNNIRTLEDFVVYRATKRGREEGRVEGRYEGREEGLEEGRRQGLQKGWEDGLQQATLAERRSLAQLLLKHVGNSDVNPTEEQLQSADAEQLLAWIEQMLASAPSSKPRQP